MIISIASGKGGTGKTTVALNLALSLSENLTLLDVDVEEPNCHIFFPDIDYQEETVYSKIPQIDENKCTLCGKCAEVCQFNALAILPKKTIIFKELCHSCGGCVLLCPAKAITEVPHEIGTIKTSNINNIEFSYGLLKIGIPASPPLIKKVKDKIKLDKINIIDCPPGTSCPAIEAVKGSDFCALVCDPTPFSLNDLQLSVRALRYLNISFGVVINRCNIGDNKLIDYCYSETIDILAQIPDDRKIAEAYSKGQLIVNALPEYRKHFTELFDKIKERI